MPITKINAKSKFEYENRIVYYAVLREKVKIKKIVSWLLTVMFFCLFRIVFVLIFFFTNMQKKMTLIVIMIVVRIKRREIEYFYSDESTYRSFKTFNFFKAITS